MPFEGTERGSRRPRSIPPGLFVRVLRLKSAGLGCGWGQIAAELNRSATPRRIDVHPVTGRTKGKGWLAGSVKAGRYDGRGAYSEWDDGRRRQSARGLLTWSRPC